MDTVQFFDHQANKVIDIPAAELAPGAICVRMEGREGEVWILPDFVSTKPGPAIHPPFNKSVRRHLRQIQSAFAEHNPQTFKQWEDGFRCDQNPLKEIAIWVHAAAVYQQFARREKCPKRRMEIYRCVVACMNAPLEHVWKVLEIDSLTYSEAESLVDRFYGRRKSA
jgi:hypothetical protein